VTVVAIRHSRSTALQTHVVSVRLQEVQWYPNAPVTFWLARHGVSEYNLEDRIGGDSSITPVGQKFAEALPSLFGHILQQNDEDHRFISVWTSTLLRTIQTAGKLPLPQVRQSSQKVTRTAALPRRRDSTRMGSVRTCT
jgi:bisphosphoglycerate-dependent phosphoglycerate mutase